MTVFGDRFAVKRRIDRLDPLRDNQEIVYLVGSFENPWLIRKSLEFALFRTYASPRISRLLARTGQFQQHGQKRYDDTTLLLAGIAERGYDSDYGRKAINVMNRLHGRYQIENEDYLYVLSTFVFEPIRWHERYGWRKPTRRENLANFYFWREVGRRMHIQDIPDDMETFEAFNRDYEARHFTYAETNRVIGEATMQIFLSWYPALLRPLIRDFLLSFMDDRLLAAFSFPKPHAFVRWLAHSALWLRAKVLRFCFPPRREPFSLLDQPNRTYPRGFQVEQLGTKDAKEETGA